MGAPRAWWTLLALAACAADGDGARACVADRACGAEVCAAQLEPLPADLAELPRVCAPPTAAGAPGAVCETAADCDRGLCLLAGACARSCEGAGDCDETQRCQPVYARSAADRLARLSACVDRVSLPDDATVARETQAIGGTDQESLSLPLAAAQTLYVVEHEADHSWPLPSGPSACRPPLCARTLSTDDRTLFDAAALADESGGPDNPVARGSEINPLTVWVPNSPRVAAEARRYRLEVESKLAGTVAITALSRGARGTRLDLNLYYVGAESLAPEGTRGVPQLAAALEEVDRIFEPAGIYLGDVRQTRVAGALPARGAALPDAEVSAGFRVLVSQYQVLPQLPELFKLSAGAANTALDIFFVADIDSRGSADIGGISGGTPIPFGMHGTEGSGIAIAADMYLQAGEVLPLARSLAHELGHALGLFHTTELDGLVIDPLPDTPVCPLTRDADGKGTLDAEECAADGGDNLMFPTTDGGTRLTPDQIEVLSKALILK